MQSEDSELDVAKLVGNVKATSWDEVRDSDKSLFDDPTAPSLARLESYVNHCFNVYNVVSNNLDREKIQECVADWQMRRGQCKYSAEMRKQRFGKRVQDSKYRMTKPGHYAIFLNINLIGVPPEKDRGSGWKACVRHELGHAIDYEKRGTSDHGPKFKAVMRKFGEDNNDGKSTHGSALSTKR